MTPEPNVMAITHIENDLRQALIQSGIGYNQDWFCIEGVVNDCTETQFFPFEIAAAQLIGKDISVIRDAMRVGITLPWRIARIWCASNPSNHDAFVVQNPKLYTQLKAIGRNAVLLLGLAAACAPRSRMSVEDVERLASSGHTLFHARSAHMTNYFGLSQDDFPAVAVRDARILSNFNARAFSDGYIVVFFDPVLETLARGLVVQQQFDEKVRNQWVHSLRITKVLIFKCEENPGDSISHRLPVQYLWLEESRP